MNLDQFPWPSFPHDYCVLKLQAVRRLILFRPEVSRIDCYVSLLRLVPRCNVSALRPATDGGLRDMKNPNLKNFAV